MLFSRRTISFFFLVGLLILPTACSKKVSPALKRAGRVSARPLPRLPKPSKPAGNPPANPPAADTNPVKEPSRIYLGKVTLDYKMEYALAQQGFEPAKNCFQYVWSNEVESIEISAGACPADGKLSAWTKVVSTLYFYSPDTTPVFEIYHASDSLVKLGYMIEDFSAPGNAYVFDLCTGDYLNNETSGKSGCSFSFKDGVITDLTIQSSL